MPISLYAKNAQGKSKKYPKKDVYPGEIRLQYVEKSASDTCQRCGRKRQRLPKSLSFCAGGCSKSDKIVDVRFFCAEVTEDWKLGWEIP